MWSRASTARASGIRRFSAQGQRLAHRSGLFQGRNGRPTATLGRAALVAVPTAVVVGGLLLYSLLPAGEVPHSRRVQHVSVDEGNTVDGADEKRCPRKGAWTSFAKTLEAFSNATDIEWSTLSNRFVDFIVPEWSKTLPGYLRKLQRELSMAPGSLADEIWAEAHDPYVHPEILYKAEVRVSDELCEHEKQFVARRRKVAAAALARYLGLDEREIHCDDVPTIAICGSGGGLRALVAGTGSLLAAQEDGLFDCVTYTSGVSGSCWLQAIYHSSIANRQFDKVIQHLKNRLGVHIAYPPAAFSSVTSAPTNKLLLSSFVEKLKGDSDATFGLVDIYGIMLTARLLVPKGELGVDERDFKLSNQADYIKYGQNPMPIYTVVRHEIPDLDVAKAKSGPSASEEAKNVAKKEAWFQWFEITPYEFFCEEFNAGIPTWAIGRKFQDGADVALESGSHLPEIRMPLLMGVFGSAFCATLSHYYREVRPLVRSLSGFSTVDEMIYGRNEDLEKVHPIDPAQIPNFVFGMKDQLRFTTPTAIHKTEHIQLMDAGMSNNLPIYPLLRPGREVDVIIAFDASADIKTDDWLSVADGYARQRQIKGWPVGVGWPKAGETPEEAEKDLDTAKAISASETDSRLRRAQRARDSGKAESSRKKAEHDQSHPKDSDLGYCTIWVGTTEERSSKPPPPSKAVTSTTSWQLTSPDAGIAVVYLPFLANPKVEGVDPAKSDYMSTWNFIYTPEQIDNVVSLAKANFDEGKDQVRGCIRAIYERKKKMRELAEEGWKAEKQRRLRRLGIDGRLGEGDHFS